MNPRTCRSPLANGISIYTADCACVFCVLAPERNMLHDLATSSEFVTTCLHGEAPRGMTAEVTEKDRREPGFVGSRQASSASQRRRHPPLASRRRSRFQSEQGVSVPHSVPSAPDAPETEERISFSSKRKHASRPAMKWNRGTTRRSAGRRRGVAPRFRMF